MLKISSFKKLRPLSLYIYIRKLYTFITISYARGIRYGSSSTAGIESKQDQTYLSRRK